MKLYFNLGRMMLSKYHLSEGIGYEDVRHKLLVTYNNNNLPGWPTMPTKAVRNLMKGVKKL